MMDKWGWRAGDGGLMLAEASLPEMSSRVVGLINILPALMREEQRTRAAQSGPM